ncbi:hypothetical protein GS872_25615 [Rhodococcus hoagii]|nr:hypothetical protein [Prescottella equi]
MIVVTHLPQVAAFADTHLVVDKTDDVRSGVDSGVRTLTEDERVVELARMLAGLDDTETDAPTRGTVDDRRAGAQRRVRLSRNRLFSWHCVTGVVFDTARLRVIAE